MSLAKKKERDEGMDYKKTAQEILNYVGGSKNIISAAHCATRLRLVIADNKKADKGALVFSLIRVRKHWWDDITQGKQ